MNRATEYQRVLAKWKQRRELIRRLHREENKTPIELAKRFRISHQRVYHILNSTN